MSTTSVWPLLLIACLPATLAGQTFTAFAGFNLPMSLESDVAISSNGGLSDGTTTEETRNGFAAGLGVSYPVAHGIHVILEGSRNATGDIVATTDVYEGRQTELTPRGGTIWIAKLGLGYRLPLEFPVQLSMGPTLLRVDPTDPRLLHREPYNNWGFAAGVAVDLPVNEIIGFRVSLDDCIVFWNSAARSDRLEQVYEENTGHTMNASVRTRRSHIVTIRTGLTYTL